MREAALLESWKAYKRGFQQGIALFNAKPKKGVAFLQARLPGCHPQFLGNSVGLAAFTQAPLCRVTVCFIKFGLW